MVIGRIKIILIAFLILGLCLLFFKNNKEDFTTATATAPLWGGGVGFGSGTIGTFQGNISCNIYSDALKLGPPDTSLLTKLTSLNNKTSNRKVILTIRTYKNDIYYYSYVLLNTSDLSIHNNSLNNGESAYELSITFLDENDPFVTYIDISDATILITWRDYPPTNCAITPWSSYNTCTATGTATCELTATSKSGTLTNTRIFIPPFGTDDTSTCGSMKNYELTQTTPCSLGICPPTNCRPGPWTASGTCMPTGTATCEPTATSKSGSQIQTRTIMPAINGGTCSTADSATTQTVTCSLQGCPTNCVPGQWTNSGTCVATGAVTCESTATSQSGLQTQTRTIAPPTNGGTCSIANSATTRTMPCSLPGCPTNCVPSTWINSGSCAINPGGQTCETSATTLSGKQLQTRVITPATNGGLCPDTSTSQTINCALSRCPIDCNPSAWTNSGTCQPFGGSNCEISLTSKSGKQTQVRSIVPSQFGGSCTDSATSKTIDCALSTRCPVPCELSAWANVGTCQNTSNVVCEPTTTSMSGLQTQFQTIEKPAEFGGACPVVSPNTSNTQTMPCRLSNLPKCTNPFENTTLVNLMTINYKDFSIFGNIPKNDVRFTSCNVGDTIATVFESMENFNEGTNTICV